MLSCAQPHKGRYPEGEGHEPRGRSDLTGTRVRAEGKVPNVASATRCAASMNTVGGGSGVIVRKAPFEDLDPSCWRGSCRLVVEDFQGVKH